jgi:PAS domain S-box-containing protein
LGVGPIAGEFDSPWQKHLMLQLLLGISALSALIVAAISRQHQLALEAVRRRERSLRELVETLPAHVWCVGPDGSVIYFSQQFRDFIGVSLDDVDGVARLRGLLNAIVHPDDAAEVNASFARAMASGESCTLKHRLRRSDGEYRWVETRAAPMRSAERTVAQWNVICLDIDGGVRAEEELRLAREKAARAGQAASLAELSASIAHEVNQPLAALVANSYACHRWLSAQPANLERAKITAGRIIRDANAAADIVSRIRALFKQSTTTRNAVAFGDVVTEVLDLMAEEAERRGVRIDADIEGPLPRVALDRVQIQQVLINLMRNGFEAMDHSLDARILTLCVRRVANAVQVEIVDRGVGIEFPDRVFEPFFTTKDHGMGMGLAICRSIVESHGGRLWEEKNNPHGAKFIFALPVEVGLAA